MNLLRNAVLKALLKGRDLISAGKAFQYFILYQSNNKTNKQGHKHKNKQNISFVRVSLVDYLYWPYNGFKPVHLKREGLVRIGVSLGFLHTEKKIHKCTANQ